MDYQAIIEALDARTLEAFKAWGDTFAKSMADALAKGDEMLAKQAEEISRLVERVGTLEKDLSEANEATQKQVRDALARAPIPTYKGVFDRGADYQAGDMVTHKGSLWHCNAAGDSEVPGSGEGWTLAVKCGRDGRDGKDLAAQPSGEPA